MQRPASLLTASLASRTALGLLAAAGVAFGVALSCSVPDAQVDDSVRNPSGTCDDGQRTDEETAPDCGGPECPQCAAGATCLVTSDCLAPLDCVTQPDGDKVCATEHCFDGFSNEGETDEDCGGGGCPPCAAGRLCASPDDCASGVCASGTCQAPSCSDEVQNQDESDIDCGGGRCTGCLGGGRCHGGEDCLSGECAAGSCTAVCSQGTAECDNDLETQCETNTTTDARHCGACNVPCTLDHATAACSGGNCSAIEACDSGFEDCDREVANGCEINAQADLNHCGQCNRLCPSNNGSPSCVNGDCTIRCELGWVDCNQDALSDGCEVRTSDDVSNCGRCANACVPPAGETAFCKDGQCGSTPCPAGRGDCDGDGACTDDLTTSIDSCGACGQHCVIVHGTPGCQAGECTVASCDEGWADCDRDAGNGCETDLTTSLSHCGACNDACDIAGSVAACEAGQCVFKSCLGDRADCNATTVDGCETDLTANAAHCGTCETACRYANAQGSCVASRCQLGSCDDGYANCDTDGTNGCESLLASDPAHCGSCDVECLDTNATAECQGGLCRPTCSAEAEDCDGDPINGCELTNTLSNCGACGISCALDHASESCSTGSCVLGACDGGYDDCDTNDANGCETDVDTSLAHCGGCGQACSFDHASATCAGGNCAMGACDGGYFDCDDSDGNGCEAQPASDPDNCGGCGNVCSSSHATARACSANSCSLTCSAGYGDFDGERITNGCELRLEYVREDINVGDNQLGFRVRLCNEGTAAASIGNYVLRYWFSDETNGDFQDKASSEGAGNIVFEVTGATGTNYSHALVVTLASESVPSGGCSLEITGHLTGRAQYNEANDYSYTTGVSQVWGKLGLYAPGGTNLVLGTPPP